MRKTVEIRIQTYKIAPAKIKKPSAAKDPEGRVVIPGVKPRKEAMNDAAAAKATAAAMTGPMIAKMTEYIIELKIAWSPIVSEIFFTAISINTSPTISKPMPAL